MAIDINEYNHHLNLGCYQETTFGLAKTSKSPVKILSYMVLLVELTSEFKQDWAH